MKTLVNRLLGLRPGEAGLVIVLGFLLLGNSLALAVSNVVSVSGFLSEVGVNEILIVWVIDMLLVILTSGLQSLIVDRFDRIRLLRWMSFGFALIYVLLRLMFTLNLPGWLNYSLLFLLTEQQWIFFPLIFWILANDLFDFSQTKRLFPVIAAGSYVGRILGLGLAAVAPQLLARWHISSAELLTFNVLIYLLIYMLIMEKLHQVKLRKTTRQVETVRETLTEGWGFVREVPSFRYLVFAMVLLNIALAIVDFHLLVVSDAEFRKAGSFQTFYSLYNLVATVAGIAIQAFVTSRLINKIQIKNTFFILPAIVLSSVGWMLVWPGIISVVLGVGLPRLARGTVDESARKSFQALVPEERRGRVSMFMDSYVFALGAMVGCLITGAVVLFGKQLSHSASSTIYLSIAALATALTIWAVIKMRIVYDVSLLNWRLKRRQRGANVLDKLSF